MNKKQKMYQDIAKHGANLNAIFNTGLDDIKLCKKLHSLELKAHKLATDYCNGENGVTTENWDAKTAPILEGVNKVLFAYGDENRIKDCLFVNGDARGYALKINTEKADELRVNGKNIYTDWGGYGILAPEFNGNN